MRINKEETLINGLCGLYESYGYKKYNPECFEEYSLFLENRDFLLSKNVITFAGSGGKLLALRPDVTLSVIKHAKVAAGSCEKLYYNENVYRQGSGDEFKEISQVGVEVVGAVDGVCQAEICLLILKTLEAISNDFVLCISHMAFIEGLFDEFNVTERDRGALYSFLKSKNTHDFTDYAQKAGINGKCADIFTAVCDTDGNAERTLNLIKKYIVNAKTERAYRELSEAAAVLKGLGYADKIKIDFSVVSDENYYDGLIFNGYIRDIPRAVLSGGRYDKLVKKFSMDCGAIGFALYLGELERYFRAEDEAVDELIIYGGDALSALTRAEQAIKSGKRVRLSPGENTDIKYKKAIYLNGDKNG